MPDSKLLLPLRLTLRTARGALQSTRDAADLGLVALDLVDRVLGKEEPLVPRREPFPPTPDAGDAARPFPRDVPPPVAPVDVAVPPPVPPASPTPVPPVEPELLREAEDLVDVDGTGGPEHVDEGREVVEEVAEPGAEDGAGASIRVEPPFEGYDALRGPDVIARLRGSDAATLAAIELYEGTHRRRRTVLSAIAREARRRP